MSRKRIEISKRAWIMLFSQGYKIGDELPLGVINALMLHFSEQEVKKCSIPSVANIRELLNAFVSFSDSMSYRTKYIKSGMVDDFLKSIE